MSNIRLLITLVILSLAFCAPGYAAQDEAPLPYREGELLVRFKDSAAGETMLRKAGMSVKERFDKFGIEHVKLPPGLSVEEALRRYREDPSVEYAEPNYILRKAVIPNDPMFGSQWGLHNIGQVFTDSISGTPDADVDAPEAWDIHTGDGTVVIAVIDSGVDYTHEEFAGRIWVNPGENCSNGIDDDGNGFVDDCRGWDFVNGDNDPIDDDTRWHGTLVSGIIGAAGNNGKGIAGMNWNVRIMPVKFLDEGGEGDVAHEIQAIIYAIDNGAQLINASYGISISIEPETEKAAVESARNAGLLFVAAAGNSGNNNDVPPTFYPASHQVDNIIAVAATTYDDDLYLFSNFGSGTVHLAAPGNLIQSTAGGNSYDIQSGTSLSAPFVSGTAALLLSYNPSLDYQGLKELILSTVDDLGLPLITGGRLNAHAALAALAAPSGLVANAISPSEIGLAWTDASTMEDGFRIERKEDGGTFAAIDVVPEGTTTYTDMGLHLGTFTYRVRATGAAGNSPYSNEASAATTSPFLSVSPTSLEFGSVKAAGGSTSEDLTISNIGATSVDASLDLSDHDNFSLDPDGGVTPCGSATPTLAPGGSCTVSVIFSPLSTGDYDETFIINFDSSTVIVQLKGHGKSKGSGGCFIATAAYGSYLAPEVKTLRDFRDSHLLTNALGRALVGQYYRYSPPMAEYISHRPAARAVVRAALTPVVFGVRYPLGALAACAAVIVLYSVGRRKRRTKR